MQKRFFIITAILLFLATETSANVTLFTFSDDHGEVWVSGNMVTRYENWDWFKPSRHPNSNNDYDYYFIRSRLGLGVKFKWVEAFLQMQDTHVWDLPNDAISPAPEGPLGIGAVYYAHRRNGNSHGTFVKQAYLRLNDVLIDGFSLKGGRFEYSDGMEVTYDNPKVMWLKKVRLSVK